MRARARPETDHRSIRPERPFVTEQESVEANHRIGFQQEQAEGAESGTSPRSCPPGARPKAVPRSANPCHIVPNRAKSCQEVMDGHSVQSNLAIQPDATELFSGLLSCGPRPVAAWQARTPKSKPTGANRGHREREFRLLRWKKPYPWVFASTPCSSVFSVSSCSI